MLRPRIISELQQLCKFLKVTYNINRGGCCFVAKTIAENLDKLGIEYSVVLYNYTEVDINQLQNHLLPNKIRFESIIGENTTNHYCLKIKNTIINKGERNLDEYKCTISNITPKELSWIYKHGDWNPSYDLNNNSKIKTIINTYFKKYE